MTGTGRRSLPSLRRRVGGSASVAVLLGLSPGVSPAHPALPAVDAAAAVDSVVRLEIEVVSETGAALDAAEVWLLSLSASGELEGRRRVTRRDGRYTALIDAGRRYTVTAGAPGHGSLELVLESGTAPAVFRRIVLPLDPFILPTIRAAASLPVELVAAGRAARRVRFSEQPLTYASVAEWLADQPGVSVRRRRGAAGQVVTVRGSRPEDVLVLLDGAPLNDPLTGRADLSLLPAATLESATLLPGAGSARYGSGATAGVLLLTSRVPDGQSVRAGARAGSYGQRAADAQVSFSGRGGRALMSVAVTRAENDYPYVNRLSPGRPVLHRENADARSLNALLTAAAGSFRSTVRLDDAERGVPGRMGVGLFDQARWLDRGWTASVAFGGAGPGLQGFGATVTAGSRRLSYSPSDSGPRSDHHAREWNAMAEGGIGGSLGLRLGARVSNESLSGDAIDGEPGRTSLGLTAARPAEVAGVLVVPALGVDAAGGTAAASPELAVQAGLGQGWRAWGRVGRGFRLPTFGDLRFASGYRIQPNPDLDAETITLDGELGVGARLDSGPLRFDGSAVGFYRRTNDPIVWLASAAAVWSPNNLGRLEAWGVELDVALTTASGRLRGWTFRLAGSLDRSVLGFGANRNPMPYQPSVSGLATIEWRHASGSYRADVRHTGSRSTSIAATRRLPAFTVFDASLSRRFTVSRVELDTSVRLYNVLDTRYELVELFPEPGRQVEIRVHVQRVR